MQNVSAVESAPHVQSARTRIYFYGLVFFALVVGRLLLPADAWQGNLPRHTVMEFTAAMLAMFVGALALVRYMTRQDNVFLFIGVGFVGAGLLDGYHALVVSPYLVDLFPVAPFAPRWIWNASPTFLSILIFGSWLTWRREVETGWYGRMNQRRLFILVAGLTLTNVLLFLLVAFNDAAPGLPLARIEVFISATFFLWALVSYLAKGHWQHDTFEHWLALALLLSFSGQTLFLFFADKPFDAHFEVALLLKLGSYLCVLAGLMGSMVAIFRQAARTAMALQQANQHLQQEIGERQRAERAETEQRHLAEALREVGNALSATLDFDQLLECLLDEIAHVVPYDTANVMLVQDGQVEIVCTRGYGRSQRVWPILANHAPLAHFPSLQQMSQTRQPLVIPDTANDPAWVHAEASPHVRSWAGTPIIVQQEVVAFLALNDSHPNVYQPDHASRLAAFAGQAAIAIQNARLYKALRQYVAELTTLNEISQAVVSSLNLQTTLHIITAEATELLGVDATSVALVDRPANDLWFAAAFGVAADFVRGKRLALGQGIVGWVAENGRPLLIADAKADHRHFPNFDQISQFSARSILCAPLMVKGETIGAIEALNKASGPFDEADLRLLTLLAGPAAIAIENARLYEQARLEIAERQRAEAALEAERALLAQRVAERTADLSTANDELARANRLKDEFLASMSHELRTPLNAILGIAEGLQEAVYGPLNEKQGASLRSIEESGRHLLTLINDILDLSKIEAGQLALECAPTAVNDVCQASLRFIRQEAHKKQLQVHTAVDPAVSVLWADERRLKQILVNLLSNAVKFTAVAGSIGLEVQGDAVHNRVCFTVWDTGIGIAPEDVPKLFRPFVQLDSRLSRAYSGTGLGLSLVYRLATMHGGCVSLTSAVGEGSRFTVALPWRTGQQMATASSGSVTPLPPDTPPLVKSVKTILLADDNDAHRETVTQYLTAKGYRALAARDGYEALALAAAERPDVILLDVQMPGIDGLQVMERLRAEVGTAVTPIIALTALAMPGDEERCRAAGATAYLSKPVSLKRILAAIEDVVSRQIGPIQEMGI